MTTNDLDALRAAVLADPTDYVARGVLGDALDDSGDLPRARWHRTVAYRLTAEYAPRWEHIRTWQEGTFRLDLFDCNRMDNGKPALAYELWHEGAGPVFWGDDFGCSPLHAVDSDEAAAALLSFLSLRPGDTDREYFNSYSPEQLAFAQEHGEELSYLAICLEDYGADAITLSRADGMPGYLLTHWDGRDMLLQTDWDWPGLASAFGWSPAEAGATGCGCNATDGTVPCPECGTEPAGYIASAADWLDAHEGETIPDPGYFTED